MHSAASQRLVLAVEVDEVQEIEVRRADEPEPLAIVLAVAAAEHRDLAGGVPGIEVVRAATEIAEEEERLPHLLEHLSGQVRQDHPQAQQDRQPDHGLEEGEERVQVPLSAQRGQAQRTQRHLLHHRNPVQQEIANQGGNLPFLHQIRKLPEHRHHARVRQWLSRLLVLRARGQVAQVFPPDHLPEPGIQDRLLQ